MTIEEPMVHPYLRAWRDFDAARRPCILTGDEALTHAPTAFTIFGSCEEFEAGRAQDDDPRFHLGLLPQPFHGPIETARAYVLMLNPGFNPRDYHWDHRVLDFRSALLGQYRGGAPFLFLDERFRAHPGHRWWSSKVQLGKIAASLAEARGVSIVDATTLLGSQLAAVELFPYHSKKFDKGLVSGDFLRSVDLARRFVREFVLPRARDGQCALVVARGNWGWRIEEEPNVVVYGGVECRTGRIGPGTRGGDLILRMLSGLPLERARVSAPTALPSREAPQRPEPQLGATAVGPEMDFEDPRTTVTLLDELVDRFHMSDERFRQLHHARSYLNSVARHRAYCSTDAKRPSRFQAGGTNSRTARRLAFCLERLRAQTSWDDAIAAAVARLPP
jgi:hypothetical protein